MNVFSVQTPFGEITYKVTRRKRMKHIKILVKSSGQVSVTTLPSVPLYAIERTVLEKSKWINDRLQKVQSMDKTNFLIGTKEDYLRYKKAAEILLTKRVNFFVEVYGVKVQNMRIKRHQTLWGSCSRTGNLNFNYQLVKLPSELVNYVVVHELCHLLEFNHSPAFWSLVAKAVPNYKDLRVALKQWNWR